jgi:spore germination cell wall hydrolase CwlJ-like protein
MKLISNILSLFIIVSLVIICMQGKPKQHASMDLSEDELGCLVENVYHESRGEDALGQAAVAYVTLNRVRSPDYPDTICGVVWQAGQFSWTEDGKSDRMTDLDALGRAVDIALAVSRGKIKDPTGGALHYFAHRKVKPRWSRHGYKLLIGEHTFISGL